MRRALEISCISLVSIDLPLEILRLIWLMWYLQESVLSINTSNYLVNSFSFIFFPMIFMSGLYVIFVWNFRKKIRLDFPTFKEILFVFSHSLTCWSSSLENFSIFSTFLLIKRVLVLSANRKNFKILEEFFMSLIYSGNSSGTNIRPCGTPHVFF